MAACFPYPCIYTVVYLFNIAKAQLNNNKNTQLLTPKDVIKTLHLQRTVIEASIVDCGGAVALK